MNPTSRNRRLRGFAIGLAAAIVLVKIAFSLPALGVHGFALGWSLAALAVLQILVQLAAFTRIEIQKQPLEDILMLSFTALILLMMVGGTILVLASLHART